MLLSSQPADAGRSPRPSSRDVAGNCTVQVLP